MKKRRDLRILWNSNSPHSNSGYATFTRDLLFRLRRDGWLAACSGFFGIDAYPISLKGEDLIDDRFKGVELKVFPRLADPYGSDAMVDHGREWKANAIFSMQDIWTLNPEHLSKIKVWIPYLPVDKVPVPPNLLEKLRYAYKAITFSDFGQKALADVGFASTLILEGTDTEIFKPMDKQEMRKKYGLPQDVFLFGMVAANKENPPRKGFQEALEAFKMFSDKHPEAAIFFHSQQQAPQGFPIRQFAQHLKIANKCIFISDYIGMFRSDSHSVAEEMNMFDVLMHPSQTEGFGLTVVEAMSCGTPAIVNDTTSMPEMVLPGKTGEICKKKYARFTNDLSLVWTADVDDLYDKMESLYAKLKDPNNTLEKDCRDHVLEKYDINKQYGEKWVPLMESLQEQLLGPLTPEKPEVNM